MAMCTLSSLVLSKTLQRILPNINGWKMILYLLIVSEHRLWLWEATDQCLYLFQGISDYLPLGRRYCSADYKDDYLFSLHIQQELEDLFYQQQVDLALWGHYHLYER